jgi:apolipoprotein N-acyltransferase
VHWRGVLVWTGVAAGAFHAAYALPQTGLLTIVYLFALLQLARAKTWRQACYSGLAVGLLIAIGRLWFFARVFSLGAVALWYVYAFWIGLFVGLARQCLRRFPSVLAWAAIPFVWLGLEYFRSELYYLRFSWLNAGYAFAGAPGSIPLKHLGMYGTGFFLMCIAVAAACLASKSLIRAAGVLVAGSVLLFGWGEISMLTKIDRPAASIRVAGVQLEFPTEKEVLVRLDELLRKFPESDLLVLSEYTFTEALPDKVKAWCAKNRKYLIIGAEEPAPKRNFYDTAFVIGPDGQIVFQQGKAVPIQFFRDGLPAREQKLWDSPWGKIGMCVCYDLSYTRVTDRLVKMGAQALIIPTMDVTDWGKPEHELHARVAPIRAAEYGVPIFRLASSGISQYVSPSGRVLAEAPYPGQGAMISATIELGGRGTWPLDRWLAPFANGVVGLIIILLVLSGKGPEPGQQAANGHRQRVPPHPGPLPRREGDSHPVLQPSQGLPCSTSPQTIHPLDEGERLPANEGTPLPGPLPFRRGEGESSAASQRRAAHGEGEPTVPDELGTIRELSAKRREYNSGTPQCS